MNKDVQNFVMRLKGAETSAHLSHLNTTGFAEHKALEEFYTEINTLTDEFVEAYSGRYGERVEVKGTIDVVQTDSEFFKELVEDLEDFEDKISDDLDLQNIVADMIQLCNKLKYLLSLD
jgi:DNA-binding ferritin-like protein